MSPISPIRLNSLKKEEVRDWLNSFEVILTDCDGVLWLHNDVIGKSSEVINKLVKIGKRVYFITNNSVKTRDGFAAKAKTMNFNVGVVRFCQLKRNFQRFH